MRFEPSYFIYYHGGSGGNFIANLAIHTLSGGSQRPIFDSTGHAHDLYSRYIKQFIPQWPADDQQLVSLVEASTAPWLVFCSPHNLRDQLTHQCVNDYNLVITTEPEDYLEITFNHYYKNFRQGRMEYSPPELLNVYTAMKQQGQLPEIGDWRQLTTEQNMRLLKNFVTETDGRIGNLSRPGDVCVAYRDLQDNPLRVLATLEEWLGQPLPHQTEKIYQEYLLVNQRLRANFWRP
jgi:hypothetical protein